MAGGKLQDIPIFSQLSKKEYAAVRKLMSEVVLDEGRLLTKQGTPGREFMVIVDGTARVEIDGVIVAHLGPGEMIGELSIISGAPRTASVIATSQCTIEVLNRREFMALLDQSPALSRKILIGAVKRLQENQPRKTD